MYEKKDQLIEITNAIKTLYDRLCNLEIDNLKETEEYNKNLDYLMVSLETEETLYNSIDITLINNMKDLIDSCLDDDNLVKSRILNQLDSLKARTKEQSKIVINAMRHTSRILTILQQYIEDEDNEELKAELIKIKYSLLFCNTKNEADLIHKSFEVTKDFCDTNLTIDNSLLDKDNDSLFSKFNSYLQVVKLIKVIISKDDVYYNTCKGRAELISLQCGIRAHFLLLDEEMITEINCMFMMLFKEKKYTKIGEMAINECFNKANDDIKGQYTKR